MATPPESPVEEHAYELEPSRTPKPIPVALEELCRQTKFSKQEIRVMYRGFKTDMNKYPERKSALLARIYYRMDLPDITAPEQIDEIYASAAHFSETTTKT